jgi:hypothetical protein
MLVALLGVFAFGAVAAAAAQAEEAPFWSREGTRLIKGETHYITAKKYSKEFTLRAGEVTVTCENARLKEGVLLGSNAGEPGTNDEVIEFFENCKVSGKFGGKTIEKCKVKEPITTTNVKSELVETEKGEKGSLLTEFFPEKGAKFTTLEFELEAPPAGFCPPNTAVEGSVAGQVRVDPNKPPELGELVSLPNGKKEAKSWLLNFPTIAITKAWLIKGGEGKEVKVELLAFSEAAILSGTTLVLLAKKKEGKFESEEVNWSPLP